MEELFFGEANHAAAEDKGDHLPAGRILHPPAPPLPFCGAQTTTFRRHTGVSWPWGQPGARSARAGAGSRLQFFFQPPHHYLGANAQDPYRIPDATAIQRHRCNLLARPRFLDYVPVPQLKRAPACRATIPLVTIDRFTMPIHRFQLLTSWADDCFLDFLQQKIRVAAVVH